MSLCECGHEQSVHNAYGCLECRCDRFELPIPDEDKSMPLDLTAELARLADFQRQSAAIDRRMRERLENLQEHLERNTAFALSPSATARLLRDILDEAATEHAQLIIDHAEAVK